MFLTVALLPRLLCFLLSQGSSCYLELEGEIAKNGDPQWIGLWAPFL